MFVNRVCVCATASSDRECRPRIIGCECDEFLEDYPPPPPPSSPSLSSSSSSRIESLRPSVTRTLCHRWDYPCSLFPGWGRVTRLGRLAARIIHEEEEVKDPGGRWELTIDFFFLFSYSAGVEMWRDSMRIFSCIILYELGRRLLLCTVENFFSWTRIRCSGNSSARRIHKGWKKKKQKAKKKKKENFTGFRIDRVESLNSAWNNISAKTIKIWKGRTNNGLGRLPAGFSWGFLASETRHELSGNGNAISRGAQSEVCRTTVCSST